MIYNIIELAFHCEILGSIDQRMPVDAQQREFAFSDDILRVGLCKVSPQQLRVACKGIIFNFRKCSRKGYLLQLCQWRNGGCLEGVNS